VFYLLISFSIYFFGYVYLFIELNEYDLFVVFLGVLCVQKIKSRCFVYLTI
jgi:hypothetical protein